MGLILSGAFTPMGAAGLRGPRCRGHPDGCGPVPLSNESGMDCLIAASIAQTSHPVRQGLVSMTQTFVDTLAGHLHHGLRDLTTGCWTVAPLR
ncbi:alanine:cation symporter family protein [Kocuria rhizophila]|nr:alanine:cation symporter family protein [Kocuria rhizophila]